MTVHAVVKMKPALKKGSGTMRGPTPRRMLMVMKAALFFGSLSFLRRLVKTISIIIVSEIVIILK